MVGVEDRGDVHAFESFVGNGGNGGIEFLAGREGVYNFKTVFVLDGGGIGPGVVDCDVEVVLFEGFDDVDYLGVAHVGAVFLEGETEDDDMAAEHLNAFFEHELDYSVGNIGSHTIVHAATCEDNLRVVAIALCALC